MKPRGMQRLQMESTEGLTVVPAAIRYKAILIECEIVFVLNA